MSLLELIRKKASTYSANARSIHSWESPERRHPETQDELEPIPLEIYSEIFSYIRSLGGSRNAERQRLKDLRSLSLVCRWFCAELLPLIFKSVVFSPDSDGNGIQRRGMTFVPFCRALNQGETFAESLASMVEHCTFRDWFGFLAGPNPAARAFLKFSMEALPNMPNITTLALYRIRLNPDPKRSNADRDRRIPSMLSTIQNLPHLSSLTLDSCDFREVTANAIEKFASRANLETFCLFLREDPLIMPPCDNITKEFLPLIKNLTKLGTDSWTLIQILISPNVSSSLRTLEALNILDLHSFSDYLYRTPSLESLTVDHLPQVLPLHSLAGQVGDAISLSQLPNLRHLSCPPHATSCFGSPRSLLSLSFTSHSDKQIYRHPISDIWSNIQSYRFIADVCLPFEFVVKTATSRVNTPNTAPQRLQRLTVVNSANFSITGGLFKATLHEFCTTWGTPSLTTLRFVDMIQNPSDRFEGNNDLKVHLQTLITRFSQSDCFPNLSCVSFCASDDEDWDWIRENLTGEWRSLPSVIKPIN